MKSHPRDLKSSPRVAQRYLLGSLGAIFGTLGMVLGALGTVLGPSWERLGRLLEQFWSPVGVLLEVRRHLESGLEVILANIAKPSKTFEGIAKMEAPRSRN